MRLTDYAFLLTSHRPLKKTALNDKIRRDVGADKELWGQTIC